MAATLLTGMSFTTGAPHHFPSSGNTRSVTGADDQGLFGQVWFPGRSGSKQIARIGFALGTVVKAGGSTVQVSLQDVRTNIDALPRLATDNVADQLVTIDTASDAGWVSNAWYRTEPLSAPRTVAYGEWLAVVLEFSTFLGSDSFAMPVMLADGGGAHFYSGSITVRDSVGAWAGSVSDVLPNVILEFTDGTFGTLYGSFPFSAGATISIDNTDAPNEYALEFGFNRAVAVDGAQCDLTFSSTAADGELVLYDADGTTVLATATLDAHQQVRTTQQRAATVLFGSAVHLKAHRLYRLAVKPTTASFIVIQAIDVADAQHWTCHLGGPAWRASHRTDGGAWTAVPTRRPFIWPLIGAL